MSIFKIMGNKAFFLDRDGVIIKDYGYVYKKEDLEFIEGCFEALKYLQSLSYKLIIVTNQSGIARGLFSEKQFHEFDFYMKKLLISKGIKIEETFYCPHHPDSRIAKYRKNCNCRKPKSGMLEQAITKHHVDKSNSFLVGDNKRDIIAGEFIGIKSFLFKSNNLNQFIRNIL